MLLERIYVDSSAFYALMDRADKYHEPARAHWPELLKDDIALVTSNYVASETLTVLQYRIGFDAAKLWSPGRPGGYGRLLGRRGHSPEGPRGLDELGVSALQPGGLRQLRYYASKLHRKGILL